MDDQFGTPDHENPEWTRADFARAKRLDQLPGDTLQKKLQALAQDGRRQESEHPEKTVIRLELSRDVAHAIQENGPDWQDQVDGALRAWLAQSKKAS